MNFDLPTPALPAPELTNLERRRAWRDMWFVDHGFIRDIYCNVRRVSPGVWRSAQPAPHHLAKAKAKGIRTVLNLRGRRDTCGSYILERDACDRLGLTLVDFPIRSRAMLDKPTLHAAAELFNRIEYPVLMHCKSGADRAGLMATFYLFVHEGVPLPQALRHLSILYGHIKHAKTGMADFFFERYLADNERHPIAFFDWVDTVYDPKGLQAEFHESRIAGFLVNRVLRRE